MDYEKKRRKKWLRALEIAECLFEEEGYHTRYLEDLKKFLKGERGGNKKEKRARGKRQV